MDDILHCHTCKWDSGPPTVAHFDFVWSGTEMAAYMAGEDLIFKGILQMYVTRVRILFNARIMMKPVFVSTNHKKYRFRVIDIIYHKLKSTIL